VSEKEKKRHMVELGVSIGKPVKIMTLIRYGKAGQYAGRSETLVGFFTRFTEVGTFVSGAARSYACMLQAA
jgi:hypothetical protein